MLLRVGNVEEIEELIFLSLYLSWIKLMFKSVFFVSELVDNKLGY